MIRSIKPAYIYCAWATLYAIWLFSLYNRQTGGMDDFDIFFKSGERLLNHENIYGPPHYYDLKYFYSVFFSSIMAILQGMELQTVKFFWAILNISLYLRILYILFYEVFRNSKYMNLLLPLLLLMTGKMVLVNFTFNQISVFILWTMIEAYTQLKQGRYLWSAIILCLGINIKIMPVFLVPYLIFISGSRWKYFVYGAVILLILMVGPAIYLGWDYNLFLIGEWYRTLNPASDIHIVQTYEYGFTDLSSLISKYLLDEPVYNEPDLHLASVSRKALFWIVNSCRLALILPVFWLAVKFRHRHAGMDSGLLIGSAIMALVPLCFPHQREYSFMLMIPMLSAYLVLLTRLNRRIHWIKFAFLLLISGMPVWEDFSGHEFFMIFKHYRLITIGMTGFLIHYLYLLFMSLPAKSDKRGEEIKPTGS